MLSALSKRIVTTWSSPGEKGISHICSSSIVMLAPSINLRSVGKAGRAEGSQVGWENSHCGVGTHSSPHHDGRPCLARAWLDQAREGEVRLIKATVRSHHLSVKLDKTRNWGRQQPVLLKGFPGGLDSKESACNVGDPGSVPGWRRSPGEGNGNPLQYSCLGPSCLVGNRHGVARSQTRLSD